jgi:hypothetical protein
MRQRGFLFAAHHLNRITIDLSIKQRRRRVASNKRVILKKRDIT